MKEKKPFQGIFPYEGNFFKHLVTPMDLTHHSWPWQRAVIHASSAYSKFELGSFSMAITMLQEFHKTRYASQEPLHAL